MKKIGIIGHFGGKKKFYDGQTIKTKTIYNELLALDEYVLNKVDTYYVKRSPIRLIIETLKSFVMCDTFIVLLSRRGMGIYFPLMYLVKKITGKKVFHSVIGGSLDELVKIHPKWHKYISSFDSNWVEFDSLKTRLNDMGINNVKTIPNFKRFFDLLSPSDIQNITSFPFGFCTFSRVCKGKGIEDAIEAVTKINNDAGKIVCTLDIYGQVDKDYVERFEEIKQSFPDYINYCGSVEHDKSTQVLKDYFALLFPTHYYTEGVPGTILDAYASALPVIAAEWKHSYELINHMSTGIVYPNEGFNNLYDALKWVIMYPEKFNNMKSLCLYEAEKYKPEVIMSMIYDELAK